MSVLTASQSAALRLQGTRPATFFSSNSTFEREIVDLVNEVADDIASAKEWRALTKLYELTGDGTTEGFDLPADYDRMPTNGVVFRPDWSTWCYTPARTLDQFQYLRNGQPAPQPGAWIILEGQMKFQPPIATGDRAQFFYLTKNWARSSGGISKSAFTADDDTYLLDERLLTLGLIWRWKAQKGLEYAEDLSNYDRRLEEISGRDSAPRIHAEGRATFGYAANVAYPWPLGQP